MELSCRNLGKRYGRKWIFSDFTAEFKSGETIALLGPNGSGKSTVLKVLSAVLLPSRGQLSYRKGEQQIEERELYRELVLVAPYMTLVEAFTLDEMINYHFQFKPLAKNVKPNEIADLIDLSAHRKKPLSSFSSGMAQRVKLALALYSDTSLVFLDEPCSNLDEEGIKWYQDLLKERSPGRTTFIASNRTDEYAFTSDRSIFIPSLIRPNAK